MVDLSSLQLGPRLARVLNSASTPFGLAPRRLAASAPPAEQPVIHAPSKDNFHKPSVEVNAKTPPVAPHMSEHEPPIDRVTEAPPLLRNELTSAPDGSSPQTSTPSREYVAPTPQPRAPESRPAPPQGPPLAQPRETEIRLTYDTAPAQTREPTVDAKIETEISVETPTPPLIIDRSAPVAASPSQAAPKIEPAPSTKQASAALSETPLKSAPASSDVAAEDDPMERIDYPQNTPAPVEPDLPLAQIVSDPPAHPMATSPRSQPQAPPPPPVEPRATIRVDIGEISVSFRDPKKRAEPPKPKVSRRAPRAHAIPLTSISGG